MIRKIVFITVALFIFAATTAHAFRLPDTGQTKCYRAVSPYDEIPCAGTGQDGEYNINPMSFSDNGNGTVTDSNTGLMWQKCSVGQNSDATCSGTAVTYNWYWASGTYDPTYNPDSQNVCGSLNLGGYSDWRLPAKKELITIVDYSILWPGPTINTTYFSNTKSSYYWSSTTSAYDPDGAWGVYFDVGSVYYYDGKDYYGYVRCVRGGQASPSFTDNGNGTVTDNKTGLVWQQGEPGYMTWGSALSYCEGLSLGGNTDWRLPNIKELESITDDTRYYPAIDTTFFPGAHASDYWSSTTVADWPYYAWDVPFGNGNVDGSNKDSYGYVRCVRGPITGTLSGFDFPLGTPDGDGYHVELDFLKPYYYGAKCGWAYHPGEDWNSDECPDCDKDAPVSAVSDGIIEYAEWGGKQWGNVALIRHDAPEGYSFSLPNGKSIQTVWSQYGHMATLSNNPKTGLAWQPDDKVFRAEQIGTVGDYPAGSGKNYHLHFEIRKNGFKATYFPCNSYPDDKQLIKRRYIDPTDFINLNRVLK